MRDYRDAKAMAQALRDNLKNKNITLSVAESLELVAKQFGFDNWNIRFEISDNRNHRPIGERMFEVTKYEPPQIFVTSRRTGETYAFSVDGDGTLEHDGARFDQGDARQTAIAYLAQRRAA
jgi:Glyoxalase superfamily protein